MAYDNGSEVLQASCVRLGLLGARITQEFSSRIAATGLTHKQVGLMAVLERHEGSSQKDIAMRMSVAPSLVVALVDQLSARGAVRRRRSATDRRVQVVELTEEGRELLARAAAVVAGFDADLRSRLTAQGCEALDAVLDELEATGSVGT